MGFFCLSKPLYTPISLLEQHDREVRNRNELRQYKNHEEPQNIKEISLGTELRSEQYLLILCCYCKHLSLYTKKTYLLFTLRDFGDLPMSSEESIVAIFDVITSVLLNIF
jgi:hypothetical protein